MKVPPMTEAQKTMALEGPVAGLLVARRTQIADGMRGLCEAMGNLSRVRDLLEPIVQSVPPGDPAGRLLLGLSQACNHLVEAVGDMPVEFWAQMLAEQSVGVEEVAAVFRSAKERAA